MKTDIEKILIPYDFSETAGLALEHAVFMAKFYKAEITLLHVIEAPSFTAAIASAFTKSDFEEKVEGEVMDKMKELANDIHHKAGIKVQVKTHNGKIYRSIVNVAEEIDANIIIMGTHGASGLQEFFMGSNAYRVVSESSCPVITVQAHATKIGFKSIALPIDDSSASRQKVPMAAHLASKYGATVHIAGLMTSANDDFVRKFRIKVEQVEDYLDKFDVQHTTTFVSGDNLASMTLNFVKDKNSDLMVIMTEQEFNITGLFLGTFAQQVVNHSKVPVLSVRPAPVDPDKLTVTF